MHRNTVVLEQWTILPYLDAFSRLGKAMSKKSSEEAILTIKEVAEYLKVAEKTIYRLAGSKKIPAFKVGGTWRFRKVDIDGWIDAQSNSAEGQTG